MSSLLNLTALELTNVVLKAEDLSCSIITADPGNKDKKIYIPAPYGDVSGKEFILKNRSNLYSIQLFAGTTTQIAKLGPGEHVKVACDGYEWFIV